MLKIACVENSSSPTTEMHGTNINLPRGTKMNLSARMGFANTANGIWASTTSATRRPSRGTIPVRRFQEGPLLRRHLAESGAGQYKHFDIEKAAARRHELIDVSQPGERRRAPAGHG
jgi:hypothetical protein